MPEPSWAHGDLVMAPDKKTEHVSNDKACSSSALSTSYNSETCCNSETCQTDHCDVIVVRDLFEEEVDRSI